MSNDTPADLRDIRSLVDIMRALRTPVTGCPWDLEQSVETIAPYTIEEAYEVADAIAHGSREELCDELGDLLLQVVFHARMAEEEGAFTFADVVEAISEKMVRRHPHVFGDAEARTPGAVKGFWERIKDEEKAAKADRNGADDAAPSALAGVPVNLPGLTRAVKLQKKAAHVGFDWPDAQSVFAKVDEELGELRDEVRSGNGAAMEEEFGDFLFAVANVGRHLGIDPEHALRAANAKFEHRFHAVEEALAQRGKAPADSSLEEMDALWDEAKEKGRRA
jgi:ATP diphosphatase